MLIKRVNIEISKEKNAFFSHVTRITQIRFLGQKVCPVARSQNDYFQGFRIFSFNLSSRNCPIILLCKIRCVLQNQHISVILGENITDFDLMPMK